MQNMLGTRLFRLMLAAALAWHAASAAAPTVPQPRLVPGAAAGPSVLRQRLDREPALAQQLEMLKNRVQPYVERHQKDPEWIVSRLQMYWQSHSTQVYVKNGVYDHAEGKAPSPTVRFTGTRDASTAYATPKLEDVKPYMGENDLLYLQNRSLPGQPWEWAQQAKTGRIVESINMRIAELARDAAFLYWYSGDDAYARFAFDIFDTYMTGLYYREMPVDLSRGHGQTLVGLQSFEVIHEDIVGPLAEAYDFMRAYVAQRAGAKRTLHDAAFKKWADVILANGVPWNNWNLIKARFVLQIAAVLETDAHYADGRGSGHYVRAVVDGSGPRQWSLQRLLDFGYDAGTAVWNESPAYSNNVANDYMECLEMLDRVFGVDLLPSMPVLPRALQALPQYLLPNGRTVGFGDTRYDFLRPSAIEHLIAHAEGHGLDAQARSYRTLLAAITGEGAVAAPPARPAGTVRALFAAVPAPGEPRVPGTAVRARIQDYQTPTFHAPNASWLIQRSGYDGAAEDALVISQAGSNGNHAHANGIAMELFAKGLSLAPESGRGSGYFQNDYAEYYAQFPAHNTVVVDGLSTYTPMKSNHPFKVQAVYPQPGVAAAKVFPWASFSDVSFTEPETQSAQARVLGIVRLDARNGYFVDIFRSRRRDGSDRYHDYIYHNLGQSLSFQAPDGTTLALAPTTDLAFAAGDPVGYDYWWDRKSLKASHRLKARFDLKLPTREVAMNMWLQGSPAREFFSVQAPPSTAWGAGLLPAGLDRQSLQTLVVRQRGAAWAHPFTAVMEATEAGAAGRILGVEEIDGGEHSVGLRVTTERGRQHILSNDADEVRFTHAGLHLAGRYGIVADREGELDYLFLGSGQSLAGMGHRISFAHQSGQAALWQDGGRWYFVASQPARLEVPSAAWPAKLDLGGGRSIAGRLSNTATRTFDMPATEPIVIR
ncbi:MAG TPA: heparinase II/III family protein [Pseudoduganella sp.]